MRAVRVSLPGLSIHSPHGSLLINADPRDLLLSCSFARRYRGTLRELREALRLARGRKHRTPEFAVEVEALAALRDDADGNVDELVVEIADDQPGLARHRCMHGMATHAVAEQGVLVICGAAADLVAGIEITQRHLDAAGLEVRVQGVTQEARTFPRELIIF